MLTRAPHRSDLPRFRHEDSDRARRQAPTVEGLLHLISAAGDDPLRRRADVLAWAAAQDHVDDVVDTVLAARRTLLDDGGAPAVADDLDALLGPAVRAVTDRALRSALTDPLTGLGTRRAFVDGFANTLAQADASTEQVVVLLADIDGLKHINDTRGHAAGDHALRRFADGVVEVLRSGDAAYRLGGDEIVLVLPGADIGSVDAVRRRLTSAGTPAASLGWAIYPTEGRDASALLEVADARLYAAKRAQRRAAASPMRRRGGGGLSHAASAAALTLAVAGGAVAAHTLAPVGSSDPRALRPASPAVTSTPGAAGVDGGHAVTAGPRHHTTTATTAAGPPRPSGAGTATTTPALGEARPPIGEVRLPAITPPTVPVPPVAPPTPAPSPIQGVVTALGHAVGNLVCLLGCPT